MVTRWHRQVHHESNDQTCGLFLLLRNAGAVPAAVRLTNEANHPSSDDLRGIRLLLAVVSDEELDVGEPAVVRRDVGCSFSKSTIVETT